MAREEYAEQVRLLVQVLPVVAEEAVFALKGGTAINLFYRDLPRLSVDIDLNYLPVEDRQTSLAAINEAMDRIAAGAGKMRGVTTRRIASGGGGATRVQVQSSNAIVKIETSPVTRGVVFDPELKRVSGAVEDEFGFAETNVVSFEDLFAGKLHAALDRQHPRDLFDVKLLYENEGLTDDLFRAFMVYVASSNRPAHEILAPNLTDLGPAYEREFVGMAKEPVDLDALLETRTKLFADVKSRLTGSAAGFLRTMQAGEPDFDIIGLPDAADLPAIRWKVLNLQKIVSQNPSKHAEQTTALEAILS
ncbi:MAG: nucleotidyl transferase AbiEii/AbiGii toxin family protein [Pseudomonadota bacterium]